MEYWSDGVLGSSTLVVVSLFRNDLNGAKRLNDLERLERAPYFSIATDSFPC
jgi:hypothetical protein